MGVKAKIEQSNPMKPPTMGEGDIDDPSFGIGSIVLRISLGKNPSHLKIMLFPLPGDDYKEQMRTLFLPSDWEHAGRMDVLRLQQGSRSFVEFSLDMMSRNNLPTGTDSFFNDEALHDTMDANMDRELARECNRENVTSIASFRDWLDEVKRLDERKRQRMEEIERTLARINAKSNNNRANSSASRPPFQPRNTNAPNATNMGMFTPMPKLTDDERALLSVNGGCYKCCTASIEPVSDIENLVAPAVAAVMPDNEGSSWISLGSWSDDDEWLD
ncbi:hypothetical protein BDN71DRAFT_1432268 [Pleurotus eryngii]|uniref:Uncharacterized protein n=1 Tax=Pleurotus eryngii TaxID=5323 RepID=A0A9P5ZU23_PLEER|nr:hypothetical protein BDN71DRAFT_1432268 [Pleurotus eryngii]